MTHPQTGTTLCNNTTYRQNIIPINCKVVDSENFRDNVYGIYGELQKKKTLWFHDSENRPYEKSEI